MATRESKRQADALHHLHRKAWRVWTSHKTRGVTDGCAQSMRRLATSVGVTVPCFPPKCATT